MDRGMKLRLAIVDDEEIVCRRLSQALSNGDFAVEAFHYGTFLFGTDGAATI